MNRTWPLLCLVALVASDAMPTESMSRTALHAHCRAYLEWPGSPGALACEAFVQGYLEGLRSEARIEARPPDRESGAEKWTDRAARTRLSRAQLDRLRQQDSYCVPENTPLAHFIRELVEHLDDNPRAETEPASDALAETLRRHHSCR